MEALMAVSRVLFRTYDESAHSFSAPSSLARKEEVLFVDLPGILSRAVAQLLLLAAISFNAVCLALGVAGPCDFAYGAFFRPC